MVQAPNEACPVRRETNVRSFLSSDESDFISGSAHSIPGIPTSGSFVESTTSGDRDHVTIMESWYLLRIQDTEGRVRVLSSRSKLCDKASPIAGRQRDECDPIDLGRSKESSTR